VSIARGLDAVDGSTAAPPPNAVTPRAASRKIRRPEIPDQIHVAKRSNIVARKEFITISAITSPLITAALASRIIPGIVMV